LLDTRLYMRKKGSNRLILAAGPGGRGRRTRTNPVPVFYRLEAESHAGFLTIAEELARGTQS